MKKKIRGIKYNSCPPQIFFEIWTGIIKNVSINYSTIILQTSISVFGRDLFI